MKHPLESHFFFSWPHKRPLETTVLIVVPIGGDCDWHFFVHRWKHNDRIENRPISIRFPLWRKKFCHIGWPIWLIAGGYTKASVKITKLCRTASPHGENDFFSTVFQALIMRRRYCTSCWLHSTQRGIILPIKMPILFPGTQVINPRCAGA